MSEIIPFFNHLPEPVIPLACRLWDKAKSTGYDGQTAYQDFAQEVRFLGIEPPTRAITKRWIAGVQAGLIDRPAGETMVAATPYTPRPKKKTLQISAAEDPDRPWEPWSMMPVGDQRNIIREVLSEDGQTAFAYFTGKFMALAPISENPVPLPFKVWRQRRVSIPAPQEQEFIERPVAPVICSAAEALAENTARHQPIRAKAIAEAASRQADALLAKIPEFSPSLTVPLFPPTTDVEFAPVDFEALAERLYAQTLEELQRGAAAKAAKLVAGRLREIAARYDAEAA